MAITAIASNPLGTTFPSNSLACICTTRYGCFRERPTNSLDDIGTGPTRILVDEEEQNPRTSFDGTAETP